MKLLHVLSGALVITAATLGLTTTAGATTPPPPPGLHIAPVANIVTYATQKGEPGILGPGTLGIALDDPYANVPLRVPAATDNGKAVTSVCTVTNTINGYGQVITDNPPLTTTYPLQVPVGRVSITCSIRDPRDRPSTRSTTYTITVHNSLALFDGPFFSEPPNYNTFETLSQVVQVLDPRLLPYVWQTQADIASRNETRACTDISDFQAVANALDGAINYDGEGVSYLLGAQIGEIFGCFDPHLVP